MSKPGCCTQSSILLATLLAPCREAEHRFFLNRGSRLQDSWVIGHHSNGRELFMHHEHKVTCSLSVLSCARSHFLAF